MWRAIVVFLLPASIALAFSPQARAQAPLLSEDFEGYALDTLIHGQGGWRTQPERYEWALIKDASFGGGWGAHGRHLILNGDSAFVSLPDLNTKAAAAVRLTLDVRPGDGVRRASQWAALLYCYAADGGIVSIRLTGSDRPNSGPIQVTDGGTDNYTREGGRPNASTPTMGKSKRGDFRPSRVYLNPGHDWAYVDHNTCYHLDLVINQTRFNRTWELRVDGGPVTSGDWGAFFGSPVGSKTLEKVVLRGGHNQQVGGLVAFDNITIATAETSRVVAGDPEKLYARIAQYMDERYYAAGTRVDIARMDLDEYLRQGRPVPGELRQRARSTDREMRQRWLTVEKERKAIATAVRLMPASSGAFQLRIENLGRDTAGESGWFGFRYAAVVFPDGTRMVLPAAQFKGGAFIDRYAYQCEPSPSAFVHGQAAQTHTTVAYFDLPRPSEPGMKLELSGLDDDKPGAVPIRMRLNRVTLFAGGNTFRENGWSEQQYDIPAKAWQNPVPSSDTREQMLTRLGEWLGRIEVFGRWSQLQADEVDELTRLPRRDLVWHKRTHPRDWWRRGFLRGMCFESDKTSPAGPAGRPWFDDNFEYVVKALAEANVNLLYFYPTDPPVYPLFAQHNRPIGTPVVECRWQLAHPREQGAAFYLDPEAAGRDTMAYVRALSHGDTELRGVALDEPCINEYEEQLAQLPKVVSAFQAYLAARREVLLQAGVTLPEHPQPILKVTNEESRVQWMEWQYFKMEYLTDFYARLARLLDQQGVLLVPIVQDYLAHEPQTAPYPPWGAKLSIVSTDLYNNGGITEAYALDLLASVNAGRTLLVPGSGYSTKTPDRFQRTLANGVVRADGVLNWIYTYAAKYRSRYFFVQPYVKDDRGREALDNWRPEYWDIQTRMYHGAARAEAYLGDTESMADLAVLYSMRSVIAESASGSLWGNTGYRNALMTFNALVNLHRAVDGCMVEGLTPARLRRYKVMFLMDAPALASGELAVLRNWVKAGGTLVVGANTSLQDQWGRTLRDYQLADLFGLHFNGFAQGVTGFPAALPGAQVLQVTYDPQYEYARVVPDAARILGRWANGDPALLMNSYDRGKVYFLAARRPGYYSTGSDPLRGMYVESRPGFAQLLRWIAAAQGITPSVAVYGASRGLEVQVRRKGGALIVHLLDWYEGRDVRGLRLKVNLPGRWKAHYPTDGTKAGEVTRNQSLKLRPVHIHDMIVLKPEQQGRIAKQ